MQAIAYAGPAATDLYLEEVRIPEPAADEVLIKVAAAGVNRPDILQRQGLYPPPQGASERLGLEVAGEIVACGRGGSHWQPGQQVCALVNGGGYAQYCVAKAAQTLPVPEGMSILSAAALPETFFTVWHNLFQRAQLRRGERVLIHGGSGGIGTTAVQMATAMGAQVITTAGSDAKCDLLRTLGAQTAVNYRRQDFVEITRNLGGANVILDMLGGDHIARNIKAAAADGRIVNIAYLKGAVVEVNFTPVMLKRLTLTGSTLRAQTDRAKQDIAQQLQEHIWPLLADGLIAPVIHKHFKLGEAAHAHRVMESREHIGKLVLVNDD
ncbi:NAD(P)H-quinone oxidoreductase [Gilvimarinus sp. 1_MG-2023]|uniref:NAD(P)H-quinone oxidoreductase n=1 Tax=Gilvimarinus sp. 1_MG-2023 TaxID=3062638 RepID=UPI0026E4160A|nr:NAD(P)H-quinone oxidoreductase [Gilvimarinus sp. 1_MG-2023]MDO6747417.1 NAD(P)H-quinone oxidoreductase [Gilvimarinus sp. 1_MG-2023]